MLFWYINFCQNANFLLKSDDDIYLHIPNLIKLFDSLQLNNSIVCHKNKSRKILRSFLDSRNYLYSIKDKTEEILSQIKSKFNKYLITFDQLPGLALIFNNDDSNLFFFKQAFTTRIIVRDSIMP